MSLQTWQETLVSSQVDGTANTAGTAASMIPSAAKYTLPTNFWAIGKQLVIQASGRISSAVTTPGTARYDIRFGATIVFDGLAVLLDTAATATNVGWYLYILLTCRAISATTANLFGQGYWTAYNILGTPATPPKGALTAMLPWNSAPAVGSNFDSTATQQVDAFFTQTAATGSHTCHQYSLISLN